jgi:lysyl-tRNA synthetase class 2
MKPSLKHILLRDELMKATRAFFAERKFTEIIPTLLNVAVPNEPNTYPFITSWDRGSKKEIRYLPNSPERSLKIALGMGLGNCFAIGHSFRNLEASSSLHAPEFLMLEWYRAQSTYQEIMKEIQEYIAFVIKTVYPSNVSISAPWAIVSLKERFEKIADTSYEKLLTNDQVLLSTAKQLGYAIENATWRQIFDQIFVNEIESKLPKEPVFLVDFPSKVSPLCKKKIDEQYIAERFELYIQGVEIANGNNENTNVSEIREVFEKEAGERKTPLDTQFLDALQRMHDTGNTFAGVGLGLDRLLMVMMGEEKIATF